MFGVGDCAGSYVCEDMNEEFTIDPECALQTALVVCHAEDSRVSASFGPRRLRSSPTLRPAVSRHKV